MNNGVEGGLYNVKAQFEPEAQKELGKKLTEELLVAWLLRSAWWQRDIALSANAATAILERSVIC